jgi:Flp pilus assembly protein TadB
MRTYYRGPDAVVTSELFVRFGSPPGRFAIRDLHRVGIADGAPEGVRLTTIAPAAAAVLVAASVVTAVGGALIGVAIVVSAAGAGLACLVVRQHRPRHWELRATYRERPVTLYTSTDERVFHQVSRALRRAIEDARPPLDGAAAA